MAKAEPKPNSGVNSSIIVPIRERKAIDPQPFDRCCFEVSKFMTGTLRHDASISREEDGAVRFDDLINKFKKECCCIFLWAVKTWANSEDEK